MAVIRYPEELPISARRAEIMEALRSHQVVVVAGETGSGKTTQLPKMCVDLGFAERGLIGCTQPRRVAAMSVSQRVAEELNVTWGREVGCKMRFNDDTSPETRVKFMTDGILLAEIQGDPLLRRYSTLIIDEAHERSLNIDFLLGYLKGLLPRRPDLKLLITSATIDTAAFSEAFGGAPVIEVSGRLFPVEIRYRPVEELAAQGADELSYVEAAVQVAEDALIETDDGDVLIFMPTERDIRITCDLLESRLGRGVEVLGLYGRMPAAEQRRVFTPGPARRVIVATNVAETSITLPRIRTVVDTGLARLSRYNARTRTRRLPIEPIAQSSARQRAGRAGRVREGLCIRLYSEEDFLKRPAFTTPEIQRANLAEVILRMKAFRLGDIETFPFLNPPHPNAIRGGYELLHELGALSEEERLTPLGRELARLPIDPTLGRMLLQAEEEKVLPEMLVLAAGLSVPDPRERPEHAKEQARAAHRAFAAPDSDFLSLLKIWMAAPSPETGTSRNALRRFCKANFLSLARMREWRELYRQLAEVMNFRPGPLREWKEERADAIHRSILAGLVGHLARKKDRNVYVTAGNREVIVFPGSNLHERREKKAGRPAAANGEKERAKKSRQPQWIVAGEIVQTSQLFARTLAKIDPRWIPSIAPHVCRLQRSQPHWDEKAGRVLCWERTLVYGLEIERRTVDYGKIDPEGATQLFIRGALLNPDAPIPHPFHQANLRLLHKLRSVIMRARAGRYQDVEEALFQFYAERLKGISSYHDLNRRMRELGGAASTRLLATEEDLLIDDSLVEDLALFPDAVPLGNTVLPLDYAYTPGEERDGVTVQVPDYLVPHLTSGQLQWMVPGLREPQIEFLLRSLPRRLRRELLPIEPKVREIAATFDPGGDEFLPALAAHLLRVYRVPVRPEDWTDQNVQLPAHLQPRVEVVDRQQRPLIVSRDLQAIKAAVQQRGEIRSDAWERTARRIERHGVTTWDFGDLPRAIDIENLGGVIVRGYPGLVLRGHEVDVRLFREAKEAARATPAGLRRLGELALSRELAWLSKELRNLAPARAVAKPAKVSSFQEALNAFAAHTVAAAAQEDPFGPPERLTDDACRHLAAHVCQLEPLFPLTQQRFEAMVEAGRKALPGLAYRLRELIAQLRAAYEKLLSGPHTYPELRSDLARLLPPGFLLRTPHPQLPHLLRYLKAMAVRAERYVLNPAKDASKASPLEEFEDWPARVPPEHHETFRWMLEEFRVQLFAPELGTAQPVSAKRLRELMRDAG